MTGSVFAAGVLVLVSAVGQAPAPGPAGKGTLTTLRQAKLTAAVKAYEAEAARFKSNEKVGAETLYQWSVRWMQAQSEVAVQPQQYLSAVQGHLRRMRSLRDTVAQRHKAGTAPQTQTLAVDYYIAEAEVLLDVARTQQKR